MQKVKDFLTEEKWTKHCEARDSEDRFCFYHDPRAAKWDIVGAIKLCYSGDALGRVKVYEELAAAIELLHPDSKIYSVDFFISVFNDTSSFQEVKAVLELADV